MMPPLTRWMVKTSLIYLLLALGAWVLTALRQTGSLRGLPVGLGPTTIHLFTVGWLTLLIFGIVFWMFPKFSQAQPRRSDRLGWVVYFLINLGLIVRLIGETLMPSHSVSGWLLVVSALLQLGAGLGFFINSWSRVKEK